ncbi:MAG: hypothetical protein ACOCXW_01485 [Bacteroidota bacterium]
MALKKEFTSEELEAYLKVDDWIIEDDSDLIKIAEFCGFRYCHDRQCWVNENDYMNKQDLFSSNWDLKDSYTNM